MNKNSPSQNGGNIQIVYILGSGRSCSTLIASALGQFPGFISVGEINNIWKKGLVLNRLCGCGLPFRECEFWNHVGKAAFGGWESINSQDVLRLQYSVEGRHYRLAALSSLIPNLRPAYSQDLSEYSDILRLLYGAIHRVSGARIIVDSSKDLGQALVLRSLTDAAVSFIHLVRDSRGVAYSWTKRVIAPDVVNRVAYERTKRPATVAIVWLGKNLLCQLLGMVDSRVLSMRYEAFVENPRQEIERVLAHLGEDSKQYDLAFIRPNNSLYIQLGHTVAGNRVRMKAGPLSLRLDNEWYGKMSARDRRLVTILSWPLLARYGYLRPQKQPDGSPA
jgi:hypothetical protein